MANKVTIDVEARFVDNVSGKAKAAADTIEDLGKDAEQAGKKVDNLGKKKANPKVGADDDKFIKKMNETDRRLAKLGRTKANANVGIKDKFTAAFDKLLSKVNSFKGKTYQALVKIRDSEALASIRKITSGAEKLVGKTWRAVVKIKDLATSPIRAIKNTLFSMKSLVITIAASMVVKKVIVDSVAMADAYSSAQIGFSTLLGESQGQQMMDDLDAFAKATPFKSSEVIAQTQRMIAMGWDAEKIIEDMTTIGDAAAATGKGEEGMQRIVTALAQIKTKGRLSTEELNQLAEAGIAAKRYIAEGLGYGSGDKGIAAMTADLEKGAIASEEALTALLAGMKEYEGMMDKTANETAKGLWSQIEDTFEINIFRRWGQGLQDGAKKGFGTIVTLLNEADGALSKFGDTIYEIGSKISNWVADKFQNAVDRILEITGSFEFDQASLGEKISMLWNGVIVDPLKEWWEGGGQQKTAETAGKIGRWMGETLTKGLLTLFGVTDILGGEDVGKEGGMNIAQSFVDGFLETFDGSAITDALLDAISNVWNALPTWAKFLVGGYAGAKTLGGLNSLIGGGLSLYGNLKTIGAGAAGLIGSTGNAMVAGSGMLGTFANTGYALTGGLQAGFASGMGGGTAALIGGSSILGGVIGGATAIKGGVDLYQAYKAHKAGDTVEMKANAASGGSALGGVAAGAAIGTLIGGPVGTLLGAGIGGLVGWIGGEKWANNIRAAAMESEEMAASIKDGDKSAEEMAEAFEKAKWESAVKRFGDIKLSMAEIARLSQQVVWGDDLAKYDKFTSATKSAEESLQSLNDTGAQTDRWLWKAGLGVTFNEDEVESIKASFDEYMNSAKTYVEDKHYEFTASAELLLDLESEGGKAVLESGNAFYAEIQEKLDDLTSELDSTLDTVLEDGVISTTDTVKIEIGGVEYEYNEQEAVTKLQAEIAKITKQIADAEADAEMALIELKFGEGNLDYDSFEQFMATTQENLDKRMQSADESFEAQVANLNLRFPKDKRDSQEYKDQLQTIIDSYNLEVDTIKADVLGYELNILGEAYKDDLGEDAAEDLKKVLEECINQGIDPVEMEYEDFIELVGDPDMKEDVAAKLQEMLGGIYDQLELIEVDGELMLKLGVTTEEGTEEKVEETVGATVPDTVDETVTVNVTGEKIIQTMDEVLPEDFDIPETIEEDVIVKLNAAETVQEQVEILATEFGIKEEEAETILWKLTGEKNVLNTITVTAEDFGIPDSVNKTVDINITGLPHYTTGSGGSSYGSGRGGMARGGVVGGASSLEAFARGGIAGFSDGGMVRGGSQLIEVAEEGSPEMIIPLSSQRRGRALKLWAEAGNIMGVPGFARGGRSDGGTDAGFRFPTFNDDDTATGGQVVQIDVHGITVEIHVNASGAESIAEEIKKQAEEIADAVAGIMADALSGQFENTPLKEGAA